MSNAPQGALWEQLLLAQTVYQLGNGPPRWDVVSKSLQDHPTLREAAGNHHWTAKQCEDTYTLLMQLHHIQPCEPTATLKAHRNTQLALAQVLYGARISEVYEQIKEKEERFRALHQRLQDLESGKLDEQLQFEYGMPLDENQSAEIPTEEAIGHLVSADDDDDADEHLQVEQDLLGTETRMPATESSAAPTPTSPPTTETQEREHRVGAQPATTYRSRARRRADAGPKFTDATSRSHSATPSSAQNSPDPRSESVEDAQEDPASDTVSDVDRDKSRRRMTHILLMLHNQVSNHTHGNLFHQAIKEVDAPNYYQVIKQPMDLKLIKQRIKEGSIASMQELHHALSLMFANALMYNRPDTEVHRMANEMRIATEEVRSHSSCVTHPDAQSI